MSALVRHTPIFRRILRAGTWLCLILLVYLSLIPHDLEVRTGAPGELEHFIAYLIAAVLFALSYPQKRALIATALVMSAGLLETLQALSPGRTARLLDLFASGAGTVLGLWAMSLISRRDMR
jgi:VanZ family protein